MRAVARMHPIGTPKARTLLADLALGKMSSIWADAATAKRSPVHDHGVHLHAAIAGDHCVSFQPSAHVFAGSRQAGTLPVAFQQPVVVET